MRCLTANTSSTMKEMKSLRYMALILATGMLLTFAAGCGTIVSLQRDREESGYTNRNFSGPSKVVYGGVRRDAHLFVNLEDCPAPVLVRIGLVVDLPVCTIADTVCLPYTVYRRLTEHKRAWRRVEVDFYPGGFHLMSDDDREQRYNATVTELCDILKRITGKKGAVRITVAVHPGSEDVLTSDQYGALLDAIRANPSYTLVRADSLTTGQAHNSRLNNKTSNQPAPATGMPVPGR